jgi:hypothetical protein
MRPFDASSVRKIEDSLNAVGCVEAQAQLLPRLVRVVPDDATRGGDEARPHTGHQDTEVRRVAVRHKPTT